MTDEKKNGPPAISNDEALRFFGEITASVTHELNNILSVIDQSAGLVDDFMASPDGGALLTEEKLKQITEKIRKNSQRGIGVIRQLNTFAHSTDDPAAPFDVGAMLENWAALTKRFADLKAASMELDLPDRRMEMKADAYLVRKILYTALKQILSSSQKNDRIKISLKSDGNNAVINMEGVLSDMRVDADTTYLEKLTASAGGSMAAAIEDSGIVYEFKFPMLT